MACLVAGPAVAEPQAMVEHQKDYANSTEMWEKAYNARDAAGVAAVYTEDGVVMAPGAETVQGREAIQALIEQDLSANEGNTLHIDSVEHAMSGDLGFARGTYSVTDADGNTVDTGKWVEVRKKVDGKWYIHRDIWNSDSSPMAAEE